MTYGPRHVGYMWMVYGPWSTRGPSMCRWTGLCRPWYLSNVLLLS